MTIHDLKYGAGKPVEAGDVVQVHYQVAASLEQLDSEELLQSSWTDGQELIVQVGVGVLRPEIDAALLGLPIGSDRRVVVDKGTWPDVQRTLALSLVLVGVVNAVPETVAMSAAFHENSVPVPEVLFGPAARDSSELLSALTEKLNRDDKRSPSSIVRLRLPPTPANMLQKIVSHAPPPMLQHSIRQVGSSQDGLIELEIARVDVAALVAHLSEMD